MARIMRRKAPQHENGGSMDKVKLSKDKKEDIKTLTFLNLMKVLKQNQKQNLKKKQSQNGCSLTQLIHTKLEIK